MRPGNHNLPSTAVDREVKALEEPMQSVRSTHQARLVDHIQSWSNCAACALHNSAKRKVFYRGMVPCDIMFIGKSPDEHEDDTGIPSIGNGLKEIIRATIDAHNAETFLGLSKDAQIAACFGVHSQGYKLQWCITNSVCCYAPDGREPDRDELAACSPRLAEFVYLCNPKLIITLGRVADKAYMKLLSHLPENIRQLPVPHPTAFYNKEDPDLEKKKMILSINSAIKNIFRAQNV